MRELVFVAALVCLGALAAVAASPFIFHAVDGVSAGAAAMTQPEPEPRPAP